MKKICYNRKNMSRSAEFSDFNLDSLTRYLQTLSREQFTGNHEIPYDQELYSRWQELIPQSQFSRITLTATLPEFRNAFRKSLQSGQVDTFIEELIQQPDYLRQVYVISSDTKLEGSQAKNRSNHSPDKLEEIKQALKMFSQIIEYKRESLPPKVFRIWEMQIKLMEQYVQWVPTLGTPEFTVQAPFNSEWSAVIDAEKSQKAGTAVLPLMELAEAMLDEAQTKRKSNQENKTPPESIGKYLRALNLTPQEKAEIGCSDTDTSLTPESTRALFLVLLKRLQLDKKSWQILLDSSISGINVNATSRNINFPIDRNFKDASEIPIALHEFFHVSRGEAGLEQATQFLQKGLDDYEETEEGIALLIEVLFGLPFGNDRQMKQAARYYAVGKTLEATQNEKGEWVAKYSLQEIYKLLTDKGVSEKDVDDIVWRIQRGTSLQRKVVEIEMEGHRFHVAECFVKDAIYFSGYVKIWDWLLEQLPSLEKGRRLQKIERYRDLPAHSLAAIGKNALMANDLLSLEDSASSQGTHPTWTQENRQQQKAAMLERTREQYERFQKIGQETIIALIDYFMVGKISLSDIQDPEWQALLKPSTLSFSQLIQPTEDR